MMSAAVPWMIVLTASRSPSERVWYLRERSSGIVRGGGRTASSRNRRSVASTIVRSMNFRTAGKRPR